MSSGCTLDATDQRGPNRGRRSRGKTALGSGERGPKLLEVYADIWCPFAHVGLRAAVRERARLGRDDVELVVRAWPLELVNGAPLDPQATADHVADLRAQVAPELFDGFDPTAFPTTTLPALALASAAYGRDAAVGEAVSLALRDALFEHGLDISDAGVLRDVALTYGIDPASARHHATVLEEWRGGQKRGVKGSPHFFCGVAEAFCPSLDIERDAGGHLLMRRSSKELASFLEGCLRS